MHVQLYISMLINATSKFMKDIFVAEVEAAKITSDYFYTAFTKTDAICKSKAQYYFKNRSKSRNRSSDDPHSGLPNFEFTADLVLDAKSIFSSKNSCENSESEIKLNIYGFHIHFMELNTYNYRVLVWIHRNWLHQQSQTKKPLTIPNLSAGRINSILCYLLNMLFKLKNCTLIHNIPMIIY